MKKKVYYEHDIHTGTSIGLEYEKYLHQSQSKYQNIEIISGLKEGDEVIRAPYSAVSKKLRNDMPISVEN